MSATRAVLARGEAHRRRLGERRHPGERAGRDRRAERHGQGRGDPGWEQPLGQREHQHQDRPEHGRAPAAITVPAALRQENGPSSVDASGRMQQSSASPSPPAARRETPPPTGSWRGAPSDPGVGGSRRDRSRALEASPEHARQRAALAPGKPEADGGDSRRAGALQPVRGPVHFRRGSVEDEPGRADQGDGDQRLHERRHERHQDPPLERTFVGEHVGGDQRLAMPRAGGVEDAIGEAETDEPPGGARVAM